MEENACILVAEDEKKLNRMMLDYFASLGYRVVSAFDGVEAMKLFHREGPDIAILDVMMPRMDGIDVTRRIRELSSIPIIILTARVEEQDKLIGLDTGADDYVTKPFSFKELAARVRAQLRRVGMAEVRAGNGKNAPLMYHGLQVDPESRRVDVDGKRVDLTSLQFDLLKGMLESPGRVFTRMDLLRIIQDDPWEGYERTIDVHIKNLRKVLEPDSRHPRYIQTVWGVGYKLEISNELPGTGIHEA
ncbi:response regulator transcription factor [Marispirochaeta aestuarii]|uniref:response regulator transcription factor n=1 Tax=Marispirochaeta aestuarii TaxID=1963862 RepID=UPI0029C6C203|nr:response regulator transcription factor [Marispirochaeta aestuarii]